MVSRLSIKHLDFIHISIRDFRSSTHDLALRSSFVAPDIEADQAAAREWLKAFGPDSIPKNSCNISFSRSSGPGGQNVNKYVNLVLFLILLETHSKCQSKFKGHATFAAKGLTTICAKYTP